MWNNVMLINSFVWVVATTYMIYAFFAAILLVKWETFGIALLFVLFDTLFQFILGIFQD